MFNPERLLGSMLFSSMRGGMGLSKGALTMGAIGVAVAAFDHFSEKNAQAAGNTSVQPTYSPPPIPSASNQTSSGSMPPPPPGVVQQAPINNQQEEAVLLIQAMIASANADGVLDAQERKSILEKLNAGGLSPEEKNFISESFISPPSMEEIIKKVNTPELAQQVYTVSLLTIKLDTEEEKDYLQNLAQKLNLSDATIQEIHAQMGLS